MTAETLSTDTVHHLNVEEVVILHRRLAETHGEESKLRDAGLLESALFRPKTGYYDDIAAMAAALFESLTVNRPFTAGNRRLAFSATDVFLRLNGWKLETEPRSTRRFLDSLDELQAVNFKRLLPWVRRSAARVS